MTFSQAISSAWTMGCACRPLTEKEFICFAKKHGEKVAVHTRYYRKALGHTLVPVEDMEVPVSLDIVGEDREWIHCDMGGNPLNSPTLKALFEEDISKPKLSDLF